MPHLNSHCYEFGPYRLDVGQRVLTRTGETVSLTPKATDILTLLVANAGQLMGKDELLRLVWPDTFVEESNLTQNIFLLRRILGDERPAPRYIETVVRRGYRFIANVREIGGEPGKRVADPFEPSSLAAGAYGPVLGSFTGNGDDVSARPSVAVLPFLNATGDHDIEYLADGLTDHIVNNLSRVSRLRVMSRSAVFRYKTKKEVDPRVVGRELGVATVLVGKLTARPDGLVISVELVEVTTGWQLWGDSFDCRLDDLLDIQEIITRRLLTALKLDLTGDEEKRITARYTENAAAYQSYLEARYHWSKYTRLGIEKAITHFRQAIELDPNYALAYAGIIDCYLRLATNYLPPEENIEGRASDLLRNDATKENARPDSYEQLHGLDPNIKLRYEWDCKNAERELRRASELKAAYPSAHQWNAACRLAYQIFKKSQPLSTQSAEIEMREPVEAISGLRSAQITSLNVTLSEEVQICCAIAREQVDAGNHEAACLILERWWQFGNWPELNSANEFSCADLLFTTGVLAGWLASTRQLPNGQKHGEALLSGAIALFEQVGSRRWASEGRIELALCYYRQGLFGHSRSALVRVLDSLGTEDNELRALALIRLAGLERHAGRLNEALSCLDEANTRGKPSGPWATARCRIELASTFKDLAISKEHPTYFDSAKSYYLEALFEFEAVGNHRLAASTENNLGYMLLRMQEFSQAGSHLERARRAFDLYGDRIRCAQADDSLAHLHLAQGQLDRAYEAVSRAVEATERGDENLLLAEALTTKGLIYCKLRRFVDARIVLEDANRLASRCGDSEGAGRALLILIEEMCDSLSTEERNYVRLRLVELLSDSEQPSLKKRLQRSLEIIDKAG
jgi:TolB-like protein/DNA-binding winged helix-turn-helix (wHTH) protein/tetratricopeptide (TPR) repeat protein